MPLHFPKMIGLPLACLAAKCAFMLPCVRLFLSHGRNDAISKANEDSRNKDHVAMREMFHSETSQCFSSLIATKKKYCMQVQSHIHVQYTHTHKKAELCCLLGNY